MVYRLKNQTLRRKTTVSDGVITTAGFPELGDQWEEFSIDDASGLGSHSLATTTTTIPVVVTLTDATGNSDDKTISVTVIDPNGSCDKPATPMNFTVNSDTAFFPSLRWTDMSNDEDGFNIYRKLDGETTFTLIAQQPEDFFFFYDVLGSGNATYYVTAYNAKGESTPSNQDVYMFKPFSGLTLNYICYNSGTDSLTWSVTNPNDQYVPFIWAQWWGADRDTLYAVPNTSSVAFKTKDLTGVQSYGFDPNVTGIWYWGLGFSNLSQEVFC